MGGTSFIFTCLAIGIILSVARHTEQPETKMEMETASSE
jgi:cell division protein FtsW